MKQYRGMSINPCLNGFIVIVGCQTLVFANLHQVAEALHRYADDPEAEEKLYLQNSLVNTMIGHPPIESEMKADRPAQGSGSRPVHR